MANKNNSTDISLSHIYS